MSLSSCTRRGALQVGVGVLALLSGCNGTEDSESTSEPREEIDLIDGVDVHTFRFETDDREVVVERESDDDGRRRGLPYVLERDAVDRLEVRYEPVGEDDAGSPLAVLREIDYGKAIGIVFQERVSACYRHSVQYVAHRTPGDETSGVDVEFCRTTRDPDVACSLDDEQVQVTVLEVPITYETGPSGLSRGISSNCRLPPNHPASTEGEGE